MLCSSETVRNIKLVKSKLIKLLNSCYKFTMIYVCEYLTLYIYTLT
jgi:hypothetical protein